MCELVAPSPSPVGCGRLLRASERARYVRAADALPDDRARWSARCRNWKNSTAKRLEGLQQTCRVAQMHVTPRGPLGARPLDGHRGRRGGSHPVPANGSRPRYPREALRVATRREARPRCAGGVGTVRCAGEVEVDVLRLWRGGRCAAPVTWKSVRCAISVEVAVLRPWRVGRCAARAEWGSACCAGGVEVAALRPRRKGRCAALVTRRSIGCLPRLTEYVTNFSLALGGLIGGNLRVGVVYHCRLNLLVRCRATGSGRVQWPRWH